MKVAIINSVYNFGSTGKIVSGLHKIIKQNGFESIVIYGREKKYIKDNTIYYVSNLIESILHLLMSRLLDRHGLHSYFTTKKICKILNEQKPDIIHLHNIHGYYININLLFNFLNEKNIPVIWTLHDCWSFTGHCAYFDKINCEKWQTECSKCPQISAYPKSLFFDRSKINYNLKKQLFNSLKSLYLIGVSEWVNKNLKKSFLSQIPSDVIYNGVDTSIFYPKHSVEFRIKHKLTDKFVILSVAKIWEPRKGLDDLIFLINSLPENFILLIVGKIIDKPKVKTDKIFFLNEINNQNELADLYSTSNLFLNLSTEDNLPMTILESLTCGTPVFTYDTGGCSEAIKENYGKVFNKGDLTSIIKYLNQYYEYYYKKLDTDIINEITIKYNQDLQFKKYIDLYIRAIKLNK